MNSINGRSIPKNVKNWDFEKNKWNQRNLKLDIIEKNHESEGFTKKEEKKALPEIEFSRFSKPFCQVSESKIKKNLFTTINLRTKYNKSEKKVCKVHIFWEGHKYMTKSPGSFDDYKVKHINLEILSKFCGHLRIH